jgi:ElaB/YqjD/DUF883 family membrane-anchored ribosome-binding protein
MVRQDAMEEHYHNMTPESPGLSREKLVEDLRVLIHDAEQLLKSGANEAGEKAAELRAKLHDSLAKAKETCRRLEDRAVAGAKAADRVIRDHPYESMGLAFGLGVLLGVLINRK